MESADDAAPGVAPLGGLVVRGKDYFTRTTGGTEQRGFGQGEQVEVAEGGQLGGRSVAQPLTQARRPAGVSGNDSSWSDAIHLPPVPLGTLSRCEMSRSPQCC